jgi:hypothetical protein
MDVSYVLCQVGKAFLNIINLNALCSPVFTIANITTYWTAWPLNIGPIGYHETSVNAILRCIISQKSVDFNFAEVQLLQQKYPVLHIKNLPPASLLSFPPQFPPSPYPSLSSKPSQCSITFPVINAVYPTKPLPSPIFLCLSSSCFWWLMFLDLQGLPAYFCKVSTLTGP